MATLGLVLVFGVIALAVYFWRRSALSKKVDDAPSTYSEWPDVDLKLLMGKLNDPCRQSLEAAASLTVSKTNYYVEVEHWFLKILDVVDNDVAKIMGKYKVDVGRLSADLNRAIERFKTGNDRMPALAPPLVKLASEASRLASVNMSSPQVRSGHILVAMLSDETMAAAARDASSQFARIPVEALARDFDAATEGSCEADSGDASIPDDRQFSA